MLLNRLAHPIAGARLCYVSNRIFTIATKPERIQHLQAFLEGQFGVWTDFIVAFSKRAVSPDHPGNFVVIAATGKKDIPSRMHCVIQQTILFLLGQVHVPAIIFTSYIHLISLSERLYYRHIRDLSRQALAIKRRAKKVDGHPGFQFAVATMETAKRLS